jgi:hypothetical protein
MEGNPWVWSPPQDVKAVSSVSADRTLPPPKPIQVAKPVSATPTSKPIEKKRTAADFTWSAPKMVKTRIQLRYEEEVK